MNTNPNSKHPIFFDGSITPQDIDRGTAGLTKREYFAALVMAQLVRSGSLTHNLQSDAELSVRAADALLKALEK